MAAASSSQNPASGKASNDRVPLRDEEGQQEVSGPTLRSLGIPATVTIVAAILVAITVGAFGQWGVAKLMGKSGAPAPAIVDQFLLTNKPSLDKREYRYAKFSNGVEVLNIKDDNTQNAGFAVSVSSGSFNDGDLPGLAHFCEHMLFLGTEKFPEETGFHDYMTMHNGYNNAYTAEEITVYFGKLDGAGFSEGLERFADFFRAPMFKDEHVAAEVHAIGSEHSKNIQSPGRRTFELLKSLANPLSPVTSFHTGNEDTLVTIPKKNGVDTVEALRSYFKQNYCAPRFRVVTFGQTNTDDQLNQVFEQFSDLTQTAECSATPIKWNVPAAWHAENLGHYLHAKAVQPQAQLWTFFAMPDTTEKWASSPTDYLQHIIGYGGEQSLEHVLKEKLGLALGVSVFADPGSAGTSFYVVFELTPKGKKNINAVIDTMFMYINQMKQTGVDMELYQSLAQVKKLQWQWSEMSDVADMVSGKAEAMTRLPASDLLSGDHLITDFDEAVVNDLMDHLVPSNMNMAFIDPDFDANEHETLPYYGVEYTKQSATEAVPIVKEWEDPQKASQGYLKRMQKAKLVDGSVDELHLKLPEAIHNIPDDINLDSATAPLGDEDITKVYGDRPAVINQNGTDKAKLVWYRQGSTTGTPKMTMKFTMRKEDTGVEPTAREMLIPKIFTSLFEEELEPKSVDLKSTGISYGISLSHSGLGITFGGFKHNLPDLMSLVMGEFTKPMKADAVQQARFDRIVEDLRDSLKDASSMPSGMAMQERSKLLAMGSHSKEELLEALDTISLKDVTEVGKTFVSQPLQTTNLIMGNIDQDEAAKLQEKFEEFVKVDSSVSIENVETVDKVVNPGKLVELRKTNPRKGDSNSVTTVSVLHGVASDADAVTFGILGQILAPLAFGELRTKQQLGYVVHGGVGAVGPVTAATVVVQGDAKLPDEIEPQIEKVMTTMMFEKLENMTQAEFESFKASYESGMLEPPLGLGQEVGMYWSYAARGGSCPYRLTNQMAFLRNDLTKDHLVDAWKKLMTPADGVRSRVVVKYYPDSMKIPQRRSLDQTVKDLKAVGVPDAAVECATREYESAAVLDKASSVERKSLQEGGSLYPAKLNCDDTNVLEQKKTVGWVKPSVKVELEPDASMTAEENTEQPAQVEAASSEEKPVTGWVQPTGGIQANAAKPSSGISLKRRQ